MSFIVISEHHRCDSCRKIYKRKHTCFGRSHRRPKGLVLLNPGSKFDGQSHGVNSQRRQNLSGNRVKPQPDLESSDRIWPCEGSKTLANGTADYLTQRVLMTSRVDFDNFQLAPSNAAYLDLSQEWSCASAKQLLQLRARVTHRQSILMRLSGDIKGSENTIKSFLSSLNAGPTCSALSEDLAALYLSQAMNHIYNFNFHESHREVKKWTPNASGGQERLLWDLILCVGRIMRGEGRFEESKICFDTCLSTPGLRESKRLLVRSALADLYCELDYLQMGKQNFCLSQANAMVELEIKRLRLSSGQHRKGFRRLLLSLTEVRIRQGRHRDADLLTRELIIIYDNIREPDIVDRLGHVRALIAFARLAPSPEDALKRWKDVLLWNKFYNPLEEEVFTCGVVYLFLCITWYKLGDIDKSKQCLQNAVQVIERKQRQFLIPGIGTYLFHDVCDQVYSEIWRLGDSTAALHSRLQRCLVYPTATAPVAVNRTG
ncbi:hypothetical protein BDFG_08196 [Blastomyces dermatitidis ATCC 26199]|nr:hypothetical protein BDFG_08196 [Blastomyces dermatitidis ATCC 26199]